MPRGVAGGVYGANAGDQFIAQREGHDPIAIGGYRALGGDKSDFFIFWGFGFNLGVCPVVEVRLADTQNCVGEHPRALGGDGAVQMIAEVGAEHNTTTIVMMPSEFMTIAKGLAESATRGGSQ